MTGRLRVWDVTDGRNLLAAFGDPGEDVSTLAIAAGRRLIATVAQDSTWVRLWTFGPPR